MVHVHLWWQEHGTSSKSGCLGRSLALQLASANLCVLNRLFLHLTNPDLSNFVHVCMWGVCVPVYTLTCVCVHVQKQVSVNIQAKGKPRCHLPLFSKEGLHWPGALHKPSLAGLIVPRICLSPPAKHGDYKPAPPRVAFSLGFWVSHSGLCSCKAGQRTSDWAFLKQVYKTDSPWAKTPKVVLWPLFAYTHEHINIYKIIVDFCIHFDFFENLLKYYST